MKTGYTVYVLHSEKYDKIYTGRTSDLKERFKSHNELGTKGWTIHFRPWKIVHTEVFATKAEAIHHLSRVYYRADSFQSLWFLTFV